MNSINNRYGYAPMFCASQKQLGKIADAAPQVVEHIIGHTVRSYGKDGVEIISTFGPDGKFIGQSQFYVNDVCHGQRFINSKGEKMYDRFIKFKIKVR